MVYNLLSQWKLWFHSIKDNNWDKGSYKKIYDIENLMDYNAIKSIFKQNHYQNGMFFVMKDGIFPNWEDPSNRLGGCLSFKIASQHVMGEWNNILLKCINEDILMDQNDKITGISIAPKKEFNIIKIWFSEKIEYKKRFKNMDDSSLNIDNSLFRLHNI
tara:strand:- start:428 stop:904 length:477 start_codon:yes stop_codon:yes gene_type:complete